MSRDPGQDPGSEEPGKMARRADADQGWHSIILIIHHAVFYFIL